MVSPRVFLRIISDIRRRFETEPNLRASVESFRPKTWPRSAVVAAIAALVNANFLKWSPDGKLVRADVDLRPPSRRTA